MTAQQLGAQATPRPWEGARWLHQYGYGYFRAGLMEHKGITTADEAFITYAVNHIEAAEARLATAERLLLEEADRMEGADITDEDMSWWHRVHAFLAAAAGGGSDEG